MEFYKKLQELRKQKGLTQQELADRLYVSRTAVSKWESGRGVPNIESLKQISQFFSVTLDELLSSDEVLQIAEVNQTQTARHFRDLVFGLVDICSLLLLFLPLFAQRGDAYVRASSLLTLLGVSPFLKIGYFAVAVGTAVVGVLILALQNCTASFWVKNKTLLSLMMGTFSLVLFILSLQPYAAIYAFSLLSIKAVILIRHR